MAFCWNLNDSKSPQVSRVLTSILVYLNNTQVGMVSTSPLIFKSLNIVPIAPITTDIAETFMYHSFLGSQARSRYMYIFFLSFIL